MTMPTTMRRSDAVRNRSWLAGAILVATGLLFASRGCGGVTDSRAAARDQATDVSCQYFSRCGQIGAGQTFMSTDDCHIQARSFWEQAWPAADCQGKLDNQALSVCLAAISGTQCGNGLNFLLTLGTCGKQNVCPGPDAGAAAD